MSPAPATNAFEQCCWLHKIHELSFGDDLDDDGAQTTNAIQTEIIVSKRTRGSTQLLYETRQHICIIYLVPSQLRMYRCRWCHQLCCFGTTHINTFHTNDADDDVVARKLLLPMTMKSVTTMLLLLWWCSKKGRKKTVI